MVKGISQNDALPTKQTAKGWHIFMQVLGELSVPFTVIGNSADRDVVKLWKNPDLSTEALVRMKL